MSLYPVYSSIPYNECSITIRTKTITSQFDFEGEERRKRKNLFPKRDIALTYNYITKANALTIKQFFRDRDGAYEDFNWLHHQINTYENEYMGVGDGSTVTWNLPGKTVSSWTVYKDQAALINTTDYTITQDAGADGAASIEFVVAPAAGALLAIDFTGYLKVHCRFANDDLENTLRVRERENLSIQLRGLLNE
jgi:hypothetical protein